MVRTEISLFLKNVPGELGKLASMLADAGINIDALTIQDASEYVQRLFKARGKSLKRIAPAASYGSMKKDSVDHALIRLLVEDTDRAIDLLSKGEYMLYPPAWKSYGLEAEPEAGLTGLGVKKW